jgi:hypothetical protein
MPTREDFQIYEFIYNGQKWYTFKVEYFGKYVEPSLELILKKRKEIKKAVKERLAWVERENQKYFARIAEEERQRAFLLHQNKEEEKETLKQLLTELTPEQEKAQKRKAENEKRAKINLVYRLMEEGWSNADIMLNNDVSAAMVGRLRVEFNKRKK